MSNKNSFRLVVKNKNTVLTQERFSLSKNPTVLESLFTSKTVLGGTFCQASLDTLNHVGMDVFVFEGTNHFKVVSLLQFMQTLANVTPKKLFND